MSKHERRGSYIGPTMSVRGNVQSAEKVTIAGSIEGELRAESVELTTAGFLAGEVLCRSFISSGRMRGLVLTEKAELLMGSRQYGRVRAGAIQLQDNVLFDCLEPLAMLRSKERS